MNNTTPKLCVCAEKIARAEADMRAKGKERENLAGVYFASAAELARIRREHFSDCEACQQTHEAQVAS